MAANSATMQWTRPASTAGAAAAFLGQPTATSPGALAFSGQAPSGLSKSTTTAPQLQAPGQNMTNPGYGEQALNVTQNRLLEDPYQQQTQQLATQAGQSSAGENYLNQNLGTLNGPGAGEQYWNQMQGQFNDPFAGEQFARTAAQNMSPTGAAGAFNTQAQGQYGDFTGYSGPQNTQGQYGMSSGELAGGSAGENMLGAIGSQYGDIGQYGGPNLAAGQYAQTQASFGALPTPDSADPFYDRAIQLGTQTYNQGAAGRGVYGSSEALNGVGNIITDLNAQRAQTAFGNNMAIAQENRMRQQLLGEQARMGDLSGTDAFNANLKGAETFGNIANQQATQALNRNELLGNMANAADSQALGAQNANIAGLSALGNIAQGADQAETNRFTATTNAMNNADRTALDRMQTGANIANQSDQTRLNNYNAGVNAAQAAGGLQNSRLSTAAGIANQGSAQDLARLNSYNNTAQGAESQRQARVQSEINAVSSASQDMQNLIGQAQSAMFGASQADWENYVTTTLAPALQAAGYDEQDQNRIIEDMKLGLQIGKSGK